MRVILSGGGTIGSVSPLLAIFLEIKKQKPEAEFLWLATRNGPEKKLIKNYNIPLKEIACGKLRRYFSWRNFLDPFLILFGFLQSFFIILKFKPDFLLSAGGFVSVPVAFAGFILGKPILIHQQDVVPGLANKLMAPLAKFVTVTFEASKADFPVKKTQVVGNPVRPDVLVGNKEDGYKFFQFNPELPVILIIGGGTGAKQVNQLVVESIEQLVSFCQVIHITGGRADQSITHPNYRSYDFLMDQLKNAYAVADLVITRAGMSVLTELAALQKPSLVIPIAGSHQEKNALEFMKNNAAVVVAESDLTPENFPETIKELLADKPALANLSRNMGKVITPDAAQKIIRMIL